MMIVIGIRAYNDLSSMTEYTDVQDKTHSTSATICSILEHEEQTHVDDLTEDKSIQAVTHDTYVEEAPILFVIYSPVKPRELFSDSQKKAARDGSLS